MSENYDPSVNASPTPPWNTTLLSQRDLSLTTPLNFVTSPGVSVTKACFGHQVYEDESTGTCISNLLAVGLRRFHIDLYWDDARGLWSFCPVAIPIAIPSMPQATVVGNSSITQALTVSSSIPSTTEINSLLGASTTSSALPTAPSSLGSVLPSVSVFPTTSNEPLIKLGSYTCTSTINLSVIISLLDDYLQKTQNTLAAHILYVYINVHAAASAASPMLAAASPTVLPSGSNYLSNLIQANLSSFVYTPTMLQADRANLNSSWYTVSSTYRPVDSYYSTSVDSNGIVSTADGWPAESYIEFSKSLRMLVQLGDIDPQMKGYNYSADLGTFFPTGYIESAQTNVTATPAGDVAGGCFVVTNPTSLASINSSWADVANLQDFTYPLSSTSNLIPTLNLTSNLTSCGISPILNDTLLNVTANEDYVPYQNYSYSSVWSWSSGEPRTYTTADPGDDSIFRCAIAKLDLGGRWLVTDCAQKYYAACRATNQPYDWMINNYQISFTYAPVACTNNYVFAAPRTALENSYLTQAMRNSEMDLSDGVWVNFNDLDVEDCWVPGGPNATCPYSITKEFSRETVVVPSVAAIIVLVVSGLLVFLKAAGHRQSKRKIKKRTYNGYVYEGVPS